MRALRTSAPELAASARSQRASSRSGIERGSRQYPGTANLSLPVGIIFGYHSCRAVVVVEGAIPEPIVTGTATMLVVGILLNIVGLGFFCWVLFTLAIYALPFFIGLTAGMYAHQAGTGPLGTIALGLVAGAFAVVLGQLVFSTVRAPILRITIALFFAAPAALAGYHATYGLSELTTSSDLVREVFAVIGAIVTGATAWTRLAASPTAVSAGPGRPALS